MLFNMNKVLRFLGGALALASAIIMGFATYKMAIGQSPISQNLVDSGIDKLFFGLVLIGCTMGYLSFVPWLWFKLNPFNHKPTGVVFFTGISLFICGMYYCFMFGSPL